MPSTLGEVAKRDFRPQICAMDPYDEQPSLKTPPRTYMVQARHRRRLRVRSWAGFSPRAYSLVDVGEATLRWTLLQRIFARRWMLVDLTARFGSKHQTGHKEGTRDACALLLGQCLAPIDNERAGVGQCLDVHLVCSCCFRSALYFHCSFVLFLGEKKI